MKTMVILTVLFASLLIMAGAAFGGGGCACYEVTETFLDVTAPPETEFFPLCLDYEDNTGTFDGCGLSLFPGLITQGLLFCEFACVGDFKFHGNDHNVITGKLYCEPGERSTFWGHITDPSNCE